MNYVSMIKLAPNRTTLIFIPRVAAILFIFLQILGMLAYPGGTMYDASTEGYSFSMNFFSDMGAYAARNGEPNYLSMIIFAISLTIVGLTFGLYYSLLPKLLGNDTVNFFMATIGSLFAIGGSICMIGTGFTPSDVVFAPHVFFANNIFHCFLVTSLLYTIVIFRSDRLKKRYAMGYALFFISIFIYVGILQYGPSARSGETALIFQVLSQKMIVIVFCCSVIHQTFGFSQSGILER